MHDSYLAKALLPYSILMDMLDITVDKKSDFLDSSMRDMTRFEADNGKYGGSGHSPPCTTVLVAHRNGDPTTGPLRGEVSPEMFGVSTLAQLQRSCQG